MQALTDGMWILYSCNLRLKTRIIGVVTGNLRNPKLNTYRYLSIFKVVMLTKNAAFLLGHAQFLGAGFLFFFFL